MFKKPLISLARIPPEFIEVGLAPGESNKKSIPNNPRLIAKN